MAADNSQTKYYLCIFFPLEETFQTAVISHFNQEYVKTGIFQKEVSKIIRNASELREQADYEDF